MTERISLIKEIREGGYEASLITTYNAYLPFYEQVVLRHLKSKGIRHNVLLMDAKQASISIDQYPPLLAGNEYTLVPITHEKPFHPKILMLFGRNKGAVFVGSHNLTISGFGYNRELSTLVKVKDKDDFESIAVVQSVWKQVLDWVEVQGSILPDHVKAMVYKVQEFATWMKSDATALPEQCNIIGATTSSESLWQQFKDCLPSKDVKRVTITGAFFDANLEFLKMIQNDFPSAECTVGIDPETVSFPPTVCLAGMKYVSCSEIGPFDKGLKKPGYLHAKAILVEMANDEIVLAVGSANPSKPAWLKTGLAGNIETMLVRRGEEAREAATELGLTNLYGQLDLEESDWNLIQKTWELELKVSAKENTLTTLVGVAEATDSDVRFFVEGQSLPESLDCQICLQDGQTIESRAVLKGQNEYYVNLEKAVILAATFIKFSLLDHCYTIIIHQSNRIDSFSRSASQRDFDQAVASLAEISPEIQKFVKCIEDFISISDSLKVTLTIATGVASKEKESIAKVFDEGAPLSISFEDFRKGAVKHRICQNNDLAHMLDVLIYKIRDARSIVTDIPQEERDAFGRSEEEQIGQDDEIPIFKNDPKEKPSKTPLEVCHQKVHSVVKTARHKFDNLVNGELQFDRFIVVMVGILAALRLIRSCDGKVPWLEAGQTSIPKKEFHRLFEKVVDVLCEGKFSIISLDDDYMSLADADELARLKALILWLAWESGLTLQRKKLFNETFKQQEVRLRSNRIVVAMAQLINRDEVVLEEARQTIGSLGYGDMEWLDTLMNLDKNIEEFKINPNIMKEGTQAKSGDYGISLLKPSLGIRQIAYSKGGNPALILINKCNDYIPLKHSNLRVVKPEELFSR